MKFAAAFVSFALALVSSVDAVPHNGAHLHRRQGPSGTYVPPSAPTSSPITTPVQPPSGGSSSIKRGISYNDPKACSGFDPRKISWAYDWDSQSGGSLPAGIQFTPMLWGTGSDHTTNWLTNVLAAIAGGAEYILPFNEPDLGAQSNLTPDAAAAAFKSLILPLAGKAKICTPAITNGGAPMGEAWLDQFMQKCDTCKFDCVAFHIYDSATNVAYYQSYISGMASRYNLPLHITEFGASGSEAQQEQFFRTMLPWLDSQSFVERYAYFMAAPGILVDTNFQLTALGELYNTL